MNVRRLRLSQRGGDPLAENGAILEVAVGHPALVAERLVAEGRPVPPPRRIRALIDTGATISGMDNAVARELGLVQTGFVTLTGIGGTTEQPVYAASVSFPGVAAPAQDPVKIAGTSLGAQDFEMLMGRDLLRRLVMTYHGPRSVFSVASEGGPETVVSPAPSAGWGGGALVAVGAGALILLLSGLLGR